MSKQLREGLGHVLSRYKRYLIGPVPSDLLYGGPDVVPEEVLIDEAMQLIDQYAYEYAERVVGSKEPVNVVRDSLFPNLILATEDDRRKAYRNDLRDEQHKTNQELSPHRATKEGGGDE